MGGTGLSYRQPELRWMFISGITALCLHGLCWFVATLLRGHEDVAGEVQRQMTLALFWMIGVLVIWKMAPSPSRLHATFTVLICALFVCVLGSVAALSNLVFVQHYPLNEMVKPFLILSLLLVLMQMSLAVPSAILLQALALRRVPPPNP